METKAEASWACPWPPGPMPGVRQVSQWKDSELTGIGREADSGHSVPRAGGIQSPATEGAHGGACVWGASPGGWRVPAVVGAVGLDAAALGALVHHLSWLQL